MTAAQQHQVGGRRSIGDVALKLAVFTGRPKAMTAIGVARKVFARA